MTSASSSNVKMSLKRAKSPGWAAFDLKQGQKECFELEVDNEPYPPMSSAITSLPPCQNTRQKNNLPVRSISSVLLPDVKFPTLTEDEDDEKPLVVGNSSAIWSNKFTDETDIVQAFAKLKELHSWADERLIEDIMAAVDNDVNKASAVLISMVDNEPYPPMSSAITSLPPCQNTRQKNNLPVRSISSVLLPDVKFPTLTEDEDDEKPLVVGNSSAIWSNKFTDETDIVQAFAKLKELHSWADERLIEDIMAAVDNDVNKASAVLISMVDNEPYPPISSAITSLPPCQNTQQKNNLPVRSISSVLLPDVKFPTLTEDEDDEKPLVVGNSSAIWSNKFTDETDIVQAFAKLKELHSWADERLIEDIMAAVDNDVNKASAVLISMVDNEPYPPISSAITSLPPCQNTQQKNNLPVRSISSVLLPDVKFPTLTEDEDDEKPLVVGNSSAIWSNKFTDETDIVQAFAKLKELHSWADERLIEDIMAAVDNDVNKASAVLISMVDNEPYPPMSSAITSLPPCQNTRQKNNLPVRSISSVLLPDVKFPTLTEDEDDEKPLVVGNSSAIWSNKFTDETDIVQAFAKLKELHSWADERLIEDIMAAVDNDVNKASAVLISMVSPENFKQNKDKNIGQSKSNSEHFHISIATQSNKFTDETDIVEAYAKFKELHSWVDESLIEDIMTAADNDVNKASTLLIPMVSADSFKQNKDKNVGQSKSNSEHFRLDHKKSLARKSDFFGEAIDFSELSYVLEDSLNCKNEELTNDNVSGENNKSDAAAAHMKLILGNLRPVPIEPEWEEDDIYLIHRKDAIRMIRLASQHSRAATDAYSRGDHLSAQQLSVKAREEWMAAEGLNAKAAKEILSIRNRKNSLWELDLHGLHAVEAVQALQERLHSLESLVLLEQSVSPDRNRKGSGIVRCASLESLGCMEMEKLDEQRASSQQRPTSLHVITGIMLHLAHIPIYIRM
ncbi:hypothetical protein CsSME_00002368 [Camellia sinensis var. sinensis]